MKLHREGKRPLFFVFIGAAVFYLIVLLIFPNYPWITNTVLFISVVIYLLFVNFFRNPDRFTNAEPNEVIAPADGKVVVVEEVEETEFFKDKRIQVSIFMSPLNVHVNRYPISGKVEHAVHHDGEFLVAWHPKASILNERTSVVIDNQDFGKIMYRQIAGALARRIIMYAKKGASALVGEDSGFIKLGSRVDIFLPLDAEILVKPEDKPIGGETVIARLKKIK